VFQKSQNLEAAHHRNFWCSKFKMTWEEPVEPSFELCRKKGGL